MALMSQLFDKGGQQSKKRGGGHRVTLNEDPKMDKKLQSSNFKSNPE